MNERIFKWQAYLGIGRQEFAAALGVSLGSLSHLASGRNKPSADLIEKLAEVYPQLSMEWLIRGKGEMIESGEAMKIRRLEDIKEVKAIWEQKIADLKRFSLALDQIESRIIEN